MSDSTPRPEYPRPQFRRDRWLTLNGTWEFEVDRADTGLERGLRDRHLSDRILVPFAPESEASGVGDTDFLQAVWYRRELTVPADWTERVILHFGAVDYDTTVWIDGVEVGRHRGGFSSFSFDVTEAVSPGIPNTIVVRARDLKDEMQPRGKQATCYENSHCQYTRTTGIWQSAKAAIMATLEAEQDLGHELPLMISMTLTDLSGRNLSGHTVEAFWASVRHARPVTIGLNCSFGAGQLRPHLAALAASADTLVMAYPNAGLPNELGEYDEAAEQTAAQVLDWGRHGLVNIVGGCCGTTPSHIAAIAGAVRDCTPRTVPAARPGTLLAGLEPMLIAA